MKCIKIGNINPRTESLLGVKLSEFPPVTLDHLAKELKRLEPATHGAYLPVL